MTYIKKIRVQTDMVASVWVNGRIEIKVQLDRSSALKLMVQIADALQFNDKYGSAQSKSERSGDK